MRRSFPGRLGPRDTRRYRLRLRADAGSVFYRTQQARVLRIFLGATTFLYAYGVAFTVFPIRPGVTGSNPVGGITAIILGLAALAWLAARPDRPGPATVAAIVATPMVMASHRTITAEFACLIAPMFLAMYLRAFYPPRRGVTLVAVLTGLSVLALAVAPAPKMFYLDYVIFVVAIVGAAESFGLLTRGLVAAACTDPLTGLLNRAGWEIATTDLLARSRSAAVTVTVIAMDIDNFKTLNDTEGHVAGDEHLISRAAFWRDIAPVNAVLARFGGDEFAVCIADRDPTGATAEKFVAGVREHTPGTSVGVASQGGVSAEIASLYGAADANLYSAKRGRLPDTGNPGLRHARG